MVSKFMWQFACRLRTPSIKKASDICIGAIEFSGNGIVQEITIDPVEIEDARWVTREEMAEVSAGKHPEIRPARKGAIAHFILHNWLADRLD